MGETYSFDANIYYLHTACKKLKKLRYCQYKLGIMSISEKFMDDCIRAIGHITRHNYNTLITVKKIREFHKIDPFNNSKISFYWRCLQSLEQNGTLKRIGPKNPKKYRVLNFFKFFELFHDSHINWVMTAHTVS